MTKDELKAYIRQYVKTNYNEEITGEALQNVLITMVNNLEGFESESYNDLTDKPKINSVELSGNKTAQQLSLVASSQLNSYYTKTQIDTYLNNYYTKSETNTALQNVLNVANSKESSSNKKTTLSNPNDNYFPTTKAVNDALNSSITSHNTSNNAHNELFNAVNTRIDNIGTVGRFLSVWDCSTGLPQTNPTSLPYTYKTGDYFIIGKLGTTTNLIPNGAQYDGTASTTVAPTGTVIRVNDIYKYDGTSWSHLTVETPTVTWDSVEGKPELYTKSETNNLLSAKIDKVTTAVQNNIATFDTNGNVKDSGSKISDFATSAQGALASTAYQKPSSGIPMNDLSSTVKAQLAYKCTVGVTTFNEIQTAINEGKFVYLENDGVIYTICDYTNNSYCKFLSVSNDATRIYKYFIDAEEESWTPQETVIGWTQITLSAPDIDYEIELYRDELAYITDIDNDFTFYFNSPLSEDTKTNEYHTIFTIDSNLTEAPNITFDETLKWNNNDEPTYVPGHTYEVSILAIGTTIWLASYNEYV